MEKLSDIQIDQVAGGISLFNPLPIPVRPWPPEIGIDPIPGPVLPYPGPVLK